MSNSNYATPTWEGIIPGDGTPILSSNPDQSLVQQTGRGDIPIYVAERSAKEGSSLSSLEDSTASRGSGAGKGDVTTAKPRGANVEAAPKRKMRIRATKRQMTVVIAGKSGAGKTTMVKKLFGIKDLKTKMAANAVTEDHTHTHTREGITVNFIETIGTNERKLAEQAKGKVDLLLYCLPIGPGCKFEEHNPAIMRCLQDAFGKDIWQYCMVVLTFSNQAWDRISIDSEEEENGEVAAIAEYKRFLIQYAHRFKQELKNLNVEHVTAELVLLQHFDFLTNCGSNRIVFVPAGSRPKDPIVPGLDYRFKIKVVPHTDSQSSESSDSSDDENGVQRSGPIYIRKEAQPENKTEVIPRQWMDVLVLEIMKRSDLETSLALLLFWFGRKRIRGSFKGHDIYIKDDIRCDAVVREGTGPMGMSVLTPDILTGIVVESLGEKKARR